MAKPNQNAMTAAAVDDPTKIRYPQPKQANGMPKHAYIWEAGYKWMPGSNCGKWSPQKQKVEVYESLQEHKSDYNNQPPNAVWKYIGLS